MKIPAAVLAAAVLAGTGFGASFALGGASKVVGVKSRYLPALKQTVLVNAAGLTLYRNSTEMGRIRCTGACATAWPPLYVPSGDKLVAGAGVVQAKLGTIVRPGGRRQATYAGKPLYRFASDRKPGDARGQGLGGVWFAVVTPGAAAPATTMPPTTAAAPTTPTDTGYTYGS
jgi:predicted lipoprotein with Yx(FWY)xxD motif